MTAMTTDDRLDRVIELLEILVERKRRPKVTAPTSDNIKQALQEFTLANSGTFTAPEIAEMAGLQKDMRTYLAISAIFTQMGVRKVRTNKARFYVIE